jgi:hypothetical protein
MPRELTLTLPDKLADDAERLGVLRPEDLEQLIGAEVRRRAADQLLETAKRMHAANLPPMSPEELEAEIAAARAELRAERARGA